MLHGVDLDLARGEVHALLGENGAGKSTFAKVLAGVHRPSRGSLVIDSQRIELASPLDARRAGITLIHQEPVSFPDLSVAENIAVGRQGAWLERFRWSAANLEAEAHLSTLGVSIDVRAPIRSGIGSTFTCPKASRAFRWCSSCTAAAGCRGTRIS